MIEKGQGGSIINTGSVAGVLGGAGPLCYSAAKAAVNHLSRSAALELAPHRIRVNNILPGPIKTPLMLGNRPDQTAAKILDFVPFGRLGEPEDIAATALFYASDDSAFITGDSMLVDGGMVAAAPGVVSAQVLGGPAPGVTGANYGTTGRKATVRKE
jgi:NAD(P)-dependent dehydrogenase (short-subunit alcohol dehydrogenase family)